MGQELKRYTVQVSRSAAKEFKKIPQPHKQRIAEALLSLENDPYIGKALKGELAGLYSMRVWPYRIMYRVLKNKLFIYVVDLGYRQGVYT